MESDDPKANNPICSVCNKPVDNFYIGQDADVTWYLDHPLTRKSLNEGELKLDVYAFFECHGQSSMVPLIEYKHFQLEPAFDKEGKARVKKRNSQANLFVK